MKKKLLFRVIKQQLVRATAVSILIASTLLLHPAIAAEFETFNRTDGLYLLYIKGEIVRGDYDRLQSLVQKRNAFPLNMRIASPGGDVVEAIRIGRLARKALLDVYPEIQRCNSACALIVFASAVNPDDDFGIGLHRPYYEKNYFAGLSFDQAQVKHKALDQSVRDYLKEMDVPTAIIDKMMAVSSDEVFYLNRRRYREEQGVRPPAVDEWLKARCGSIPANELEDQKDLGHLSWLDNFYKPNIDREYLEQLEKEHGEGARRAKKLSPGYRDYLMQKDMKRYDCERASIEGEQRRILAGFKKANDSAASKSAAH